MSPYCSLQEPLKEFLENDFLDWCFVCLQIETNPPTNFYFSPLAAGEDLAVYTTFGKTPVQRNLHTINAKLSEVLPNTMEKSTSAITL